MRLSRVLHSGGKAKPGWTITPDQMYHPQIPDRHFYGDHWFYNGFTLWLRSVRPYLEKIGGDTYSTSKVLFGDYMLFPLWRFTKKRLPDVRYQVVALIAGGVVFFDVGHRLYYLPARRLQNLKNAVTLSEAHALEEAGFWDSKSEATEKKTQLYNTKHAELNELWTEALRNATETRSFAVLCSFLPVEDESKCLVPPVDSNPMRLNLMPYGKDNGDTITFGSPEIEAPMYPNAGEFGSIVSGDYVDRVDPKPANLRNARRTFTMAYIPGTK